MNHKQIGETKILTIAFVGEMKFSRDYLLRLRMLSVSSPATDKRDNIKNKSEKIVVCLAKSLRYQLEQMM